MKCRVVRRLPGVKLVPWKKTPSRGREGNRAEETAENLTLVGLHRDRRKIGDAQTWKESGIDTRGGVSVRGAVAFGTGCSHAIRPKYHQTETPQGMDDGEFAVVGIEGLVAQSVLIDDAGTTPGRRAGGAVDGDHGRPASGAATDLGVENRARHVRRIRRPDAARRGATVPGARADETRALGSVGDPAIDQVNIWVDRFDTDPARTEAVRAGRRPHRGLQQHRQARRKVAFGIRNTANPKCRMRRLHPRIPPGRPPEP